jgi:hypothetical protein
LVIAARGMLLAAPDVRADRWPVAVIGSGEIAG